MSTKKNLIQCPFCAAMGKRVYLGEMTKEGSFNIMRFKQFTVTIESEDYKVRCGECGNLVYIHNEGQHYYVNNEGTVPLTLQA